MNCAGCVRTALVCTSVWCLHHRSGTLLHKLEGRCMASVRGCSLTLGMTLEIAWSRYVDMLGHMYLKRGAVCFDHISAWHGASEQAPFHLLHQALSCSLAGTCPVCCSTSCCHCTASAIAFRKGIEGAGLRTCGLLVPPSCTYLTVALVSKHLLTAGTVKYACWQRICCTLSQEGH